MLWLLCKFARCGENRVAKIVDVVMSRCFNKPSLSVVVMDDISRAPSFLIDNELWDKFNGELRAACHWCTHHHTTTPAEAAKQLERGEGWPRDWISRKVKNSTRQFGGLFICPALDCAGHSNSKGERRRRWFCRFCINRHLGVDLKNFFQLDEVQEKWVQAPNLVCWHCQAKHGESECVNCPQKHSKRAKRLREGTPLNHQRGMALLNTPSSGVSGVAAVLLAAAGDSNYDRAVDSGEGRINQALDNHNIEESHYVAAPTQRRTGIPHGSPCAELRFVTAHQEQRSFFADKSLLCRDAQESIVPSLIDFVNNSCTPFHATAEARRHLLSVGFQQLNECDEWALQPGGRYFFTRNMSSIFAFAVGRKYKPGCGFHVVAAHTDSPCPKLKPVSASSKGGFLHVRVQTYGAGLWQTWFDRDLSIAGRVLLRRKGGELVHELVRIRRPILRIPTFSIHSDRLTAADVTKTEIDAQLAPVLAIQIEAELSVSCESDSSMHVEHDNSSVYAGGNAHHPLLLQVLAEELKCDIDEIADFELSVYDTQPGCVGGARHEFVFAGRLDNLATSFCALWALLDTCSEPVSLVEESSIRMVALFDNGEIASDSAQGVGTQTMFQAMMRIARWLARGSESEGVVERTIRRSFIVAADMAHALHPSCSGLNTEDSQNHPKVHEGLVIKHDANQSNATDAVTAFLFREVAKRNCIPTQNFAVMRDAGCCSTVDPIIAAGYGIRIVDCGLPQLSMHSVREMCGSEDVDTAFRHFRAFFLDFTCIDEQLRVDC